MTCARAIALLECARCVTAACPEVQDDGGLHSHDVQPFEQPAAYFRLHGGRCVVGRARRIERTPHCARIEEELIAVDGGWHGGGERSRRSNGGLIRKRGRMDGATDCKGTDVTVVS